MFSNRFQYFTILAAICVFSAVLVACVFSLVSGTSMGLEIPIVFTLLVVSASVFVLHLAMDRNRIEEVNKIHLLEILRKSYIQSSNKVDKQRLELLLKSAIQELKLKHWAYFQNVRECNPDLKVKSVQRDSIEYPPGVRLRRFFQLVYTTRTYERVFAEQFSDMEVEYIEALGDNRPKKAKWVIIRGYLILALVVIQHLISSILGKLIQQVLK